MSEIKQIMDIFGIKATDGQIRGTHLAQVLTYLSQKKCEDYTKTVNKLGLMTGMGTRCLKDNYLNGIEDFGIIQVSITGNQKIWKWIGIKSLSGEEIKIEESPTDYMNRKNKEKETVKEST